MMKSFSFFVLLLVLSGLVAPCHATEPTDLGQGLAYLRVTSLDDSAKGLTAALRERDALVLDLRYTTASAEAVAELRTALNNRSHPERLLVLVSPDTPPAVAEALSAHAGKFLLLGIRDSAPAPQVVVEQTAEADRLAYEALVAGRTVETLTSGKIDKPRYDEAALMKEFAAAASPDSDSDEATPAAPATVTAPAKPEAAPPTDRVLQRAIHLHRALRALKQR
jgi:hypothetical protein